MISAPTPPPALDKTAIAPGQPHLAVYLGIRGPVGPFPGFPPGNLVGMVLLTKVLTEALRYDGLADWVGSLGTLDDGILICPVGDERRAAAVAERVIAETLLLPMTEIATASSDGWHHTYPARPTGPFERHLTEESLERYRLMREDIVADQARYSRECEKHLADLRRRIASAKA